MVLGTVDVAYSSCSGRAPRSHRAAWPVCGISWTKATRLALTFCLWPRCIGSVANIVNWRVIGDELGHVLNDSDARVFFIGAKLQSSIELISARIPGFSTHHCGGYGPSQNEDPYESCFVAAISVAADPYSVDADTALVIYSSGLPGWPKGFVLSRRALVNHIKSLVQLFLLGKGTRTWLRWPLFYVGGFSYAFLISGSRRQLAWPANPELQH